ncbi:hypothetical protein [Myxacorys almedinensis]|uniref:Uncharacterized protein n=1 Tax=Myxacorys almedinensis A TaxID=2690445 RepID=A0A8J7Z1G7_9CYAN|nr:hypothetical protein [Myxacorys almedinensis]NDJ16046.1 hypothetical protein [Myxacorys almedinensis A]
MKTLKLMTGLASATLVLASCGSPPTNQANQPSPIPQTFSQPTVPAAPPVLPSVPIQGMIQVTNGSARVAQISAGGQASNPSGGDRDPFAALPPGDLRISPRMAAQLLAKPTPPQKLTQSQPQPKAQSSTSASFPLPKVQVNAVPGGVPNSVQTAILPAPAPITALPPLAIAATASASVNALPNSVPVTLTALAETVTITGVLQVGGKLTAIVQEPDASPRYVQSGDYLANGQVLLKRITMSRSGEPTIILQQNGKDVIKSLGA